MNIRARSTRLRLLLVLAFVITCAVLFAYLWVQAGGKLPLQGKNAYRVSVPVSDVDNTVRLSDVQIAGVHAGDVRAMKRQGNVMRLELELNDDVAPLHDGVTAQVSAKSIMGQSYVRLDDGSGKEIPSGAVLPRSAVKPSTQLQDILRGLDKPTRESLGSALRSLGKSTNDSSKDISRVMNGMANLGREGHTALDALAAQSEDIKELMASSTPVLEALDSGQGKIAQLVNDANDLASATAGQREALAQSVRELPGVVSSTRNAVDRVDGIAGSLRPVAQNLRSAAPALNSALEELPATTKDLRGLLPALDQTLIRAPATLQRVPPFGAKVREFAPTLKETLRDVNPMVRYLAPFRNDISGFLANFHALFRYKAEDGLTYLRLGVSASERSPRGVPANLDKGPLRKNNPYPAPDTANDPTINTAPYPKVRRDPP